MLELADPALTVALLCQQVLEEKDGTLSAIRVVDRIVVEVETSGPGEAELPPLPVNAVLLLLFKKQASAEQSFTASVTATSPSGKETAIASLPASIQAGPGKGVNIILRLGFGVKESGVYWFTVAVDGHPMRKVPLEIVINRTTAQTTAVAQTG